ncbi:RIO-like serine/threonine protein kinase fused to N-terminal HTH domain protein [Methanomethylovorans hollandica DSM 15978]|jgi:RIO kinase 2|uniref:non-specific serine/threonine protein kinase n=1 Tax=Methanomethylovorans hollandica (strain DSM 15978 / NBRC 107637 / DMS1) TaxID=867904 RepID=L0KV80_METHD|nr:RIO1 family regulatory kinase/ATPase [Methanomethylovorans hollandica]AGB49046.1 RIO-like serine/threonine protein kinase fused to N-terminal HTH domain protein [Methanomethylovorans hollandica DSM 15978]
MIDEVIKVFKQLDNKDIRILTGIEIGMKDSEWVPVENVMKYTRMTYDNLSFKLKKLAKLNLLSFTNIPYEGYQIYFEGYDALALHTFVQRKTISAIGNEIGVGKESVVLEAIKESELGIGDPEGVVIKFHREGRTSFTQVKRNRGHIGDREHMSWIYAARLAAKREADVMNKLYPEVSVPRLVDHNRHALVMDIAQGSLLYKTKLADPQWFLDEILRQLKLAYAKGFIHADMSEYNTFVHEGGVQIIDWPQYVEPSHPHADELLERDISNILSFFKRKYDLEAELESSVAYVKSQ